jgi:uncharacterized RDD family membrane protein YckC
MQPLSDKHTIETPEQMLLEFPVAGIGSRFLALAVDTLIQVGVAIVALIVIAVLGVGARNLGLGQSSVWFTAALVAGGFFLMYGYFACFEMLWNGQTPGKRIVGIRVVKESGRPLTPAEVIGRNLLRIVDQLPGFYAIGVLVAIFSPKTKRLGDFVVGSLVVRETSFAPRAPIWLEEAMQPFDVSRLTLEDLTLIDTFLYRRHDLAPEVRARIGAQIALRMVPKLYVPVEPTLPVELVLESLSYARRSAGGYS